MVDEAIDKMFDQLCQSLGVSARVFVEGEPSVTLSYRRLQEMEATVRNKRRNVWLATLKPMFDKMVSEVKVYEGEPTYIMSPRIKLYRRVVPKYSVTFQE